VAGAVCAQAQSVTDAIVGFNCLLEDGSQENTSNTIPETTDFTFFKAVSGDQMRHPFCIARCSQISWPSYLQPDEITEIDHLKQCKNEVPC